MIPARSKKKDRLRFGRVVGCGRGPDAWVEAVGLLKLFFFLIIIVADEVAVVATAAVGATAHVVQSSS
jgi:hypothetical protein